MLFRSRLAQVLLLDPASFLYHGEVVHRDGRAVGYLRAASYGHTLGGAVGLAMIEGHGATVDRAWLDGGEWTVDVAGRQIPARLSLRPMYDPDNARIKG